MNVAPTTTARMITAMAIPNGARDEIRDSIGGILMKPGPAFACRVRGSSAWIASATRPGSGVSPSNSTR
jgi:hypothetical protein